MITRILGGGALVLVVLLGVQTARLGHVKHDLKQAIAAQHNPATGKLWKTEAIRDARALVDMAAKIQSASVKETVRRETVIQKVHERSKADAALISRMATTIVAQQQESRRASALHDNDRCLDSSAVMRLADVD